MYRIQVRRLISFWCVNVGACLSGLKGPMMEMQVHQIPRLRHSLGVEMDMILAYGQGSRTWAFSTKFLAFQSWCNLQLVYKLHMLIFVIPFLEVNHS